MGIKVRLEDGFGTGLQPHVHKLAGGSKHAGLLVLNERFLQFSPELHPFLNETLGNAMNQNVTFSGGPELILDGGTGGTEWTATANSGTWDFAVGGKATITSANNSDSATFDDAGTIDMSSRTAITGLVDLDTYSESLNTMIVQFGLAGAPLGNSVNLNDYIDTADFAEQAFVIPKDDLGIGTLTVDEMTITMTRTGGAKPTVKFDDWQIEQTGAPIVFKASGPLNKRFHVTEIRITIVDDITGITTVAGATENATVPNLAYDALLGIGALTNGIVFQRVDKGEVAFAVSIKQLGDFLATGSNIVNHISDGTNTLITILVKFPEPLILDGRQDSFLSFTINDNLSGFLQFTAVARGAVEVDSD